eukprot:jgi/Chrzof1/2133/Cz11g03230.t1_PGR7[v5.2]
MHINAGSLQAAHLAADNRCSLLVQPITYPARGVASVALQGTAQQQEGQAGDYKLNVEQCVYFGGLDHQSANGLSVSGEEFRSAEPDILRHTAQDVITTWNSDRAEDVYRIVSSFLKVPLVEMQYAELLWLDRLGMYIRCELLGREPQIVRVPFMRPVIDDRDARSVITMAAQLAWEKDRSYTPPLPSIFQNTN